MGGMAKRLFWFFLNSPSLNKETPMRNIRFDRKPAGDGVDDFSSLAEENEELPEEEENLDSEIDFDKPTFRQDIWNDYSEDLDYDQ
jgi:hypothetical protein